MNSQHVGVAAVGDVLDLNCWSSIPYFFFQAGYEQGIVDEPWSLDLSQFSASRKWWNLKQLFLGKGKGGYQYSTSFLNKAERQIPGSYFSSHVISFNQLFPRASSVNMKGGKMYYYIDITLADIFRQESYRIAISASMQNAALAQEKENYHKAEAIITMGKWVHESLKIDYEIDEKKIFQVLPGANIDLPANFIFPRLPEGAGKTRNLVLGFVGKDWERKGLLFVLEVQDELVRRGYRVKVKIVGNCPKELLDRAGIEYSGFIDKKKEVEKFIEVITSCDIGCLFSQSEALGISTLEFLHAGVPVAGFFHQGLKDTLIEGASLRFALSANARVVADELAKLILQPELLEQLKKNARRISPQLTWRRTAQEIQGILQRA